MSKKIIEQPPKPIVSEGATFHTNGEPIAAPSALEAIVSEAPETGPLRLTDPSDPTQIVITDVTDDEILDASMKSQSLADHTEMMTADQLASAYFLEKTTESFKCLAQVLFSESSFFKIAINYFPPLTNPGIDDAFNYVEPDDVVDDIGAGKYKKMCDEFGIVAITRIMKSLETDVLDLKYYGLTVKQMLALSESLKINGHVKHLVLQDNWMSPEATRLIGDVLRENNSITILNLRECRIGPEGAEALSEGVGSTQFLQELDLSFNSLRDKGLKFLQQSLIENTTIKKLNIGHNNLTEDSGATLEAILLENKTVEDLNISWNGFSTGPGNKKLCNGLMQNGHIRRLNISWNGIGTKQSMLPVLKYVKNSPVLEFLDISNNRLTKESLRMLRMALLKSTSLVEVRAGNNIYTTEEAQALATALANNKFSLVHLNMENMSVNKTFLPVLRRIFKTGKTVTFGQILSNFEIYGPNVNQLMFARCKYLAMKPKKKKKKKDFGHFVLALPDSNLPQDDFRAFLKKKKVKKIDADLLNGLMAKFATKGQKVDCVAMKKALMALYPDTELPPPPKKKKGKKSKKNKKKK